MIYSKQALTVYRAHELKYTYYCEINPDRRVLLNYKILVLWKFSSLIFEDKTRHLIGRSVEQPSIASPDWSVI